MQKILVNNKCAFLYPMMIAYINNAEVSNLYVCFLPTSVQVLNAMSATYKLIIKTNVLSSQTQKSH